MKSVALGLIVCTLAVTQVFAYPYHVERGDTLEKVARRMNLDVEVLVRANPGKKLRPMISDTRIEIPLKPLEEFRALETALNGLEKTNRELRASLEGLRKNFSDAVKERDDLKLKYEGALKYEANATWYFWALVIFTVIAFAGISAAVILYLRASEWQRKSEGMTKEIEVLRDQDNKRHREIEKRFADFKQSAKLSDEQVLLLLELVARVEVLPPGKQREIQQIMDKLAAEQRRQHLHAIQGRKE